ncbi:MAG: AAA family ATPase [Methanosarcinaceae archaeon]|nr:AAA family ATPase [Methanosarcinaceae archaeon]
MKPKLHLASFRLKKFKAVQDSKTIKFAPLTAFIGNNGSGKSSIIESQFRGAWAEKKCWFCKKMRAINSQSVYNN